MENAYKTAMKIADEFSKRKYLNSLSSKSEDDEKMTWTEIYKRDKGTNDLINKLKEEHRDIFEIAYLLLNKKKEKFHISNIADILLGRHVSKNELDIVSFLTSNIYNLNDLSENQVLRKCRRIINSQFPAIVLFIAKNQLDNVLDETVLNKLIEKYGNELIEVSVS